MEIKKVDPPHCPYYGDACPYYTDTGIQLISCEECPYYDPYPYD